MIKSSVLVSSVKPHPMDSFSLPKPVLAPPSLLASCAHRRNHMVMFASLLCVISLLLALARAPHALHALRHLDPMSSAAALSVPAAQSGQGLGLGMDMAHVPLSVHDTVTNRCFLAQHESRTTPCRPLLGVVQKRFRSGLLPSATQVVVSDAYRFIYLKTRKVAGTSIFTGFFRAVLCAPRAGDPIVDKFFGLAPIVPVRQNCSRVLLDPPLDDMQLPPSIGKIPLAKLHNYFVFAAARNPYERAVSSYEYCGLKSIGTFEQFTRDPRKFGDKCGRSPAPPSKASIANAHWDPQIQEMCDATGLNCAVDYVVDTANLVPMMDDVVSRINAGRNMSYPPLPRFSDMAPTINARRNRNYSSHYEACPECRRQVFDHYKEDVVMFGYDFEYGDTR